MNIRITRLFKEEFGYEIILNTLSSLSTIDLTFSSKFSWFDLKFSRVFDKSTLNGYCLSFIFLKVGLDINYWKIVGIHHG